MPFRNGGEWFAIFSSEDSYSAVNVRTGKQFWRVNWPTRYGVNAADPIVAGDQVLISSGYNKGTALFPMTSGEPVAIWKNKVLRTQINSAVLLDGFVYGIDGDSGAKAKLTCVEWKTGTVKWTEPSVGFGSLMAADGKLIVLSDEGELMVAPASPEKFAHRRRRRCSTASAGRRRCWRMGERIAATRPETWSA